MKSFIIDVISNSELMFNDFDLKGLKLYFLRFIVLFIIVLFCPLVFLSRLLLFKNPFL